MGAKNVLVSMGKDGAILVAEDGSITYSPVPKGKLVNSIGAGDSMVAGFLTGYIETNSYEKLSIWELLLVLLLLSLKI